MSDRELGRVKWFDNVKGYGFVRRLEGEDVFLHFRHIRGEGYRTLREGQLIRFRVVAGRKGPQAEDVEALNIEPTAPQWLIAKASIQVPESEAMSYLHRWSSGDLSLAASNTLEGHLVKGHLVNSHLTDSHLADGHLTVINSDY